MVRDWRSRNWAAQNLARAIETHSFMPILMTSSVAHTAAGLEKIYVVHRTSSFPADGFKTALPEERTTDSAYLSEDQAYATAIRRQIAYMERQTGETIVDLRTLVTIKGGSLKDRFENMREWIESTDWFVDAEVVEYHVEPCPLARLESIDVDHLLDGLDEQDYTTENSEDETDEEGDPEDEVATAEHGNGDATGKKRRRD